MFNFGQAMSGMGQTLKGWGTAAGNFIKNNPEQFAIMADMMGSKMAPGNMFAGVGQHFGASSLANKERAAQEKMRQEILAKLGASQAGLPLSQPQQAPQAPSTATPTDAFGAVSDLEKLRTQLTPKDQPGFTGFSVGPDGQLSMKATLPSSAPAAGTGNTGNPPPTGSPQQGNFSNLGQRMGAVVNPW